MIPASSRYTFKLHSRDELQCSTIITSIVSGFQRLLLKSGKHDGDFAYTLFSYEDSRAKGWMGSNLTMKEGKHLTKDLDEPLSRVKRCLACLEFITWMFQDVSITLKEEERRGRCRSKQVCL